MRTLFLAVSVLGVMCAVDLYYSNQLLAYVADSVAVRLPPGHAFNRLLAPAAQDSTAAGDIHLVAEALNSRYMQWGAVGVMLSLFVWLITRHLPAQDRRRDDVIREVIARADLLAKETRDTFIHSLRDRDQQYLACLKEIRESSERQADRAFEAKDKLASAFVDVARSVDALRKR